MNKLILIAAIACVANAQVGGLFGGQAGAAGQRASSTGAGVKKLEQAASRDNLAARQAQGNRNKVAQNAASENFFNEKNQIQLAAHDDSAKDKKVQLSFGLHDQERKSSGVKFAQGNKKAAGARQAGNAQVASENFNNAALQANKANQQANGFESQFFKNTGFAGNNFGNFGGVGGSQIGGLFQNGGLGGIFGNSGVKKFI